MSTRREFLKSSLLSAAATASVGAFTGLEARRLSAALWASEGAPDPWLQLPAILARIQPPVFAERQFSIVDFGAKGDNQSDNTTAIARAIEACHKAGGGHVIVPAGEFLTGAVRLLSNVDLHIEENGVLRFSRDPKLYPLVFTRWEGMELMNFSPFVYAFEQENIGLTGKGTIDGNCDCEHWWPWKGRANCGWSKGDVNQFADRDLLYKMVAARTPVAKRIFGLGHYLRPQFIQPYRCKNILIDGLKLLNAPMWQVHPVLSKNITVRNLYISSFGPNTDGCDPESCEDVLIDNCFFNTGDDCIAIKAGRNEDGRRVAVPSRNIVIQNCHMKDGHGGITVGSEISAGVSNVFAQNCRLDSPHLDSAVRIKNNALRGGLLENIFVRDIEIGQVAVAGLNIDFYYEEGPKGEHKPICRNVQLERVKLDKTDYAVVIRGYENAPVENVTLRDCVFAHALHPNRIENVRNFRAERVLVNGHTISGVA